MALTKVIAGLASAPVVAATAKTYYVGPSGHDSAPGSSTGPFRTIQKCADVAVGGDTCLIGSGTYRETVTPHTSGSAGAPITFASAPGAEAPLTAPTP